ncbi:hypothetical protein [Amycolatopsis sp. NPDC051372]|uniref:hypothetical protein n=1 Tax=Amycolatopsis sp. NPDC051372 TaxID=3155669 RepID=UPI0034315452
MDGKQVEGTSRAHQVPLAQVREDFEHLSALETWLRSYRPEELFDERGCPTGALDGRRRSGPPAELVAGGLSNVHDRAESAGGRFTLDSHPRRGVRIQ